MIVFDAKRHGAALDPMIPSALRLTAEQREGLLRFAELVSQWGRKTDLVAGASVDQLLEVLFVDAFHLHLFMEDGGTPDARKERWVDVGAGAGAPSIPLALLSPSRTFVLRELRRKRLAFMRHAAGALGLATRVRVEEPPAEDAATFDVALSRATFAPAEWLDRAVGMSDVCLVLLGQNEAPSDERWTLQRQLAYALPSGSPRRLVQYGAR